MFGSKSFVAVVVVESMLRRAMMGGVFVAEGMRMMTATKTVLVMECGVVDLVRAVH